MTAAVTRPLLRYHGGKWMLASWILSFFPTHRIYVESYGGGGSVLLRKTRSIREYYNELDGQICNLFKVCRDAGKEFERLITLTPFSRQEYKLSYVPTDDPLEQARRTVLRAYAGFGSAAATGYNTGFRPKTFIRSSAPAMDWARFPDAVPALVERLRGVCIENKEARSVELQHDTPETLIYSDPPYVHDTRSKNQSGKSYRFEMTDAQHEEMCLHYLTLKSMIVLSGYENDIYNDVLQDWKKVYRKARADGGGLTYRSALA